MPGPLAIGSDTPTAITRAEGGSGANVSAWLADLGVPVELIARVGADADGDQALGALSAHGVALRVRRDRQLPTGRCIVIVSPGGERTMLPDPGANAGLDDADTSGLAWGRGDLLHVSGYCLLREGPRVAVLRAMESARDQGVTVSVDASSAAPLRDVGSETVLSWLREGDILFANEAEACALGGSSDPIAAARLLARREVLCVVKLGPRGAMAALGDQQWRVAAEPADVVDTTGAGDAFAAGFLASWRQHADAEQALGLGARTAARAVARAGGRP